MRPRSVSASEGSNAHDTARSVNTTKEVSQDHGRRSSNHLFFDAVGKVRVTWPRRSRGSDRCLCARHAGVRPLSRRFFTTPQHQCQYGRPRWNGQSATAAQRLFSPTHVLPIRREPLPVRFPWRHAGAGRLPSSAPLSLSYLSPRRRYVCVARLGQRRGQGLLAVRGAAPSAS